MPGRLSPLVTGEYYHVFNRGVNKQPIFLDRRDYHRALELIKFYSFVNTGFKYSHFTKLSVERRATILEELRKGNKKLVEFTCFVLMPNHFHFLIKQLEDGGISKFLSKFQNSYTRYFNTKNERIGPLLQGYFKSIRVEDNSQLLHLSRYIHLNPFTSFVIKDLVALKQYSWSSYPQYLNHGPNQICNMEIILSQFQSPLQYKEFVSDRASYQRELNKIKHLIFED